MAKKDPNTADKPVTLGLHQTSKFTVLDAPGVTQPDLTVLITDDTPGTASTTASNDEPANTKEGGQGRRALASSGPKMQGGIQLGGDCFVKRTANPDWLKARCAVYDSIQARRQAELNTKKPVEITVTMPDGKLLDTDKEGNKFLAWKTTPFDVARCISQGLADAASVARVTYTAYVDDYSPAEDGMEGVDTMADAMEDSGVERSTDHKTILWDMTRPLVGSVTKMELLKFEDDQEAKTVFWHSSAHMLGEALEHLYGCKLTIGPPLAGGFYYDSYMGKDAFREEDCKYNCGVSWSTTTYVISSYQHCVPCASILDTPVESEVTKIIKAKQKFERMVITKEEGLELFADNPFKVNILKTKVADGTRTTVYKCGDLIDLCRGPHLPNTGKVKAFATTRHSATNWLGDTNNDTLQRMYGISFPDKKMLKVWQENQEKVSVESYQRQRKTETGARTIQIRISFSDK
jgi:threonyl-tRNA synthetase